MEQGGVTHRGLAAWLAGVPKMKGAEAGEGSYLPAKLLRWSNSTREERSGGSSSARRLGGDPTRNSRAWRGVEERRRGR